MNRNILFALLFAFASSNAFSQNESKLLRFGVTASVGMSTGLVLDKDENKDKFQGFPTWELSYGLGVNMKIRQDQRQNWLVGLEFRKVGDESNFYDPDISRGIFSKHQFRSQFYSLSIPIIWKYQLMESISLDLGFNIDYYLLSRLYLNLSDEVNYLQVDHELERSFNISPSIGIGYIKELGSAQMQFGITDRIGIIKNSANLVFGNKLPNRAFNTLEINCSIWF